MPFIVLGGIYGGIFTPTEAAAVAAMYGFVAGTFIYRELKLKDLPALLMNAGIPIPFELKEYEGIQFGLTLLKGEPR